MLAYRLSNVGVYIIGADGSGLRRLSQSAGVGYGFSTPQWSPDGHRVTYFAGPVGHNAIWVVNADGTGEKQIAVTAEPLHELRWPAWSPTGDRIAFVQVSEEAPLPAPPGTYVLVDPDGGHQAVPSSPLLDPAQPLFSPDGRYLVGSTLRGWQSGSDESIVLIDARGTAPYRLLLTSTATGRASWQRLAP